MCGVALLENKLKQLNKRLIQGKNKTKNINFFFEENHITLQRVSNNFFFIEGIHKKKSIFFCYKVIYKLLCNSYDKIFKIQCPLCNCNL